MRTPEQKAARRGHVLYACGVEDGTHKATLVDQASAIADEWYSANPMPCGSKFAVDAYHAECRASVRVGMAGVIGFLTILYLVIEI